MDHASLLGRAFRLGEVLYVVAREQPHATRIRCFREAGVETTVVNLPLVFVLEQLADEVRLQEPA
jgi:hypothetical protein